MELILSVIVPVYNEAATLAEVLARVVEAAPENKEILVVDDGSTDGTAAILNHWEDRDRVRVFRHEKNRGKGAAIRTGLAEVRGKYVVIQDADLEYDPNDYHSLLLPLERGWADVVYGSRRLGRMLGNRDRSMLSPYRLAVAGLNCAVKALYRLDLTDEATCYKMFPTSTLKSMELECTRFEFCPEVTAKAARMKLRLTEVPIRYSPRSRKDGKKIGMLDAVQAFQTLWRWRNWQPAPSHSDYRIDNNDSLHQRDRHASHRDVTTPTR